MNAEVLRDLAHARAVFQLRSIEAVIRGPAIADRSPQGGDEGHTSAPSRSDESAVPNEDSAIAITTYGGSHGQ